VTYKQPPAEIVRAIDFPPPPLLVQSPDRTRGVEVHYDAHPPISMLARPFLRLAGLRVDPERHARRRTGRVHALTVLPFDGSPATPVEVPGEWSSLGVPVWSDDATRFAFGADQETGTVLYFSGIQGGEAQPVPLPPLNDVIAASALLGMLLGVTGAPVRWWGDQVIAWTVPDGRAEVPARPAVPVGPVIEETEGKSSQMATFQDLLTDEIDDEAFEILATSQLLLVDPVTGERRNLGAPGMYMQADPSPDGQWLLVTRIVPPFSHRVPYSNFARSVEIWNRQGELVQQVAELPVADEVPRQGVRTGPRNIAWKGTSPAMLVWEEALDGGDPTREVENRDKVMALDHPFTGEPSELLRVKHRFAGMAWMHDGERAMLTKFDRDRRWRTTWLADVFDPTNRTTLFDLSVNDAYGDPGSPITRVYPDGRRTAWEEDGDLFLTGAGASPAGLRPFLDRFDPSTGEKQRLWESDPDALEQFVSFVGDDTSVLRIQRQAADEPVNSWIIDLRSGERRRLTDHRDPHPELTGSAKQLVRYQRSDGVELSATLHLPPGYELGSGRRLPVLVWAYPMDYGDPDTAGQVRGSDKTFTRLAGSSPLWLLSQGWAVLMDAAMPVVGDPDTMNDTFVAQVVDSAQAAIDHLDSLGVVDRDRVAVAGHSYGGFMTATLLAHTDLFAAGIARSGAYNRTLTPFGFQTERRSFWEAREVYLEVSPFTYADQIKAPILLIHGAADNNTGTHTVQSERLFQALQGNGATARLVLLPAEEHGYRARESVLHTVAEMLEWLARHVPAKP
jgi:dipeptidyl aminopeptidase/acylaminoacyl peptidase